MISENAMANVYIWQGNKTQASLDEDLIAELELHEQKSFEELVRWVIKEAWSKLAVLGVLEIYRENNSLTESEEQKIQELWEGSDRGYESDWSWQGSDEEHEMDRKLWDGTRIQIEKLRGQVLTSKSKN